MSTTEQKIVKTTITWCNSVKKNISKFSYEFDEYYDDDDDDGIDDAYYIESGFKDAISKQREKLDDLYTDIHDYLEDYDGNYEYELHQAQMAIDSASMELQDIENNYNSLDSSSHYNNQIVNVIEALDEAIDYLIGCKSDFF